MPYLDISPSFIVRKLLILLNEKTNPFGGKIGGEKSAGSRMRAGYWIGYRIGAGNDW